MPGDIGSGVSLLTVLGYSWILLLFGSDYIINKPGLLTIQEILYDLLNIL